MRYAIWTSGCQMNRADSARLSAALRQAGHEPVPLEQAEVVFLNTCSVRENAERRARRKLLALAGLKRRRPELRIVLTGCMVGVSPAPDLPRRFPMVDAFFPPSSVAEVLAAFPGTCPVDLADLPHLDAAAPSVTAFLPIIYGCNHFCTYCIVPLRRGRERSRPPEEILAEARCMVAQGVREITLLGQNVDAYGHDLPGRPTLAGLLHALQEIEGLWRIRFLTSHPGDMTPELIVAVATLPKVCPEISLPIQAGHDALLRRMGRRYTVAEYRALVEAIRSAVPEVALSTDVIVGFPGESEEEYRATRQLLLDIRFDVVHIAAYSVRPGTAASRLPDDVPPEVKEQRRQELEALQEKISAELNARYLGREVEVLVEDRHQGKWRGRNPQGKWCFFEAEGDWTGQMARIQVTQTGPWSLQGRLSEAEARGASVTSGSGGPRAPVQPATGKSPAERTGDAGLPTRPSWGPAHPVTGNEE
ncbi:MAG: tRNA (N6-isopentenyl adenosine(37)-C2)-methylthiotransferase MiaB [Chloroflexia bacterium]